CQVAHSTVAAWEHEMDCVLVQLEVTSPVQKALGGLLECLPLYGEPLIRVWQARLLQYPDTLAKPMIEHHLAFFPLWGLQDSLTNRDASIWVTETLVQSAQNLLGVMAGVNRLYFSPFQFKRMRRFVQKMAIKPPDFAERIESLFRTDAAHAAEQS